MMDVYIWLGLMIVFLLIEGMTYQLVSIWLALGALVVTLGSIFVDNAVVEIVLFILVSAVSFILTRPLVKKIISKRELKTSLEEKIGKQAVVIEQINNLQDTGRVKIAGIDWAARSENNKIIPTNTIVIIKEIKGVKLIVVPEGTEEDTL